MKKFTYLSFFILFAIANTACAQNTMIQNITFKSNTRGGQKLISVSESSINFTNNGVSSEHNTEVVDWKKLISLTDNLKLDQIESYDPPSEGRARDAAWHSTLIIKTEGGEEYSTVSFDNAKAPKELNKIMSFLMEIDKKYNEDAPVLDY